MTAIFNAALLELPQAETRRQAAGTARALKALARENGPKDTRPRHIARMETARECFECEAAVRRTISHSVLCVCVAKATTAASASGWSRISPIAPAPKCTH